MLPGEEGLWVALKNEQHLLGLGIWGQRDQFTKGTEGGTPGLGP